MKGKKRVRPLGPKALSGSAEAKRQAVVLLEVLSGLRAAREGSRALGVSVTRYYLLETRALQGMLTALEPRPRGRQLRPEDERERLQQAKGRLEREVARLQTLVRAAQRSLGIPPAGEGGSKMGTPPEERSKKRRKVPARAVKAIRVLRPSVVSTEAKVAPPPPS